MITKVWLRDGGELYGSFRLRTGYPVSEVRLEGIIEEGHLLSKLGNDQYGAGLSGIDGIVIPMTSVLFYREVRDQIKGIVTRR